MKGRLLEFARVAGKLMLFCCTLVHAAPNEATLGKAEGYPVCSRTEWNNQIEKCKVGSFSHIEDIFGPSGYERISRASQASPLPRATGDPLAGLRYSINGQDYSIDDYLARNQITGLLILKDGQILREHYQYDRNETHRFVSFSMAKTIIALAVGLALADGAIVSLDDLVSRHVPALAASQYGRVSIRNALNMASGAYNPASFDPSGGTDKIVPAGGNGSSSSWRRGASGLAALNPVTGVTPGTTFSYFGGDTFALGLVVRAATGKTPARLVAERIWGPMGAEDDASWITDLDGNTIAHWGFNARLRDFGRLGALLANHGRTTDGRSLVPAAWLNQMATQDPARAYLQPGRLFPDSYFGYGFQTWLYPTQQMRYALQGLWGQKILIDPALRLVMVQTAVWPNNYAQTTTAVEADSLFIALVNRWSSWADARPASFSASTSNSPVSARRLTAQLTAATTDRGKTKIALIGAWVPGAGWYFLKDGRWMAWSGGALPVYRQTPEDDLTVAVLPEGGMNLSAYRGTMFYAGFGLSETDILDAGKYALIHTVE